MAKYDAILIGAGLSGLLTGAQLAYHGMKVLLLEKRPYIGGRASCVQYRGHVVDNGAHMPSEAGHLEKVFDMLHIPYPQFYRFPKGEGYWKGEWRPMADIFPMGQAREVFKDLAAMSAADIERCSDVSVRDWCVDKHDVEGWHELFQYLGQLALVGNKTEDLSIGELLYFFWEHLQRGKGLNSIGGSLSGGLSSLTDPLMKYIESHGGEICLGCPVNDILVADGKVWGVEVEIGERLFPSHILDTRAIEAPIVVSTLPVWDLFKVISEEEFPDWYRDWIHRLRKKVCHVWTIVCSVDRPLWDVTVFKWVPRLPRAGVFGLFFHHQSYGDKANEYQINLVLQGNYNDLPDLSEWQWAKTRRAVRRFLDLLEEDAKELIPGLAKATKWRVRQASVLGLAEEPGISGIHRPSMVPPGIENFYIVSDTVREARGLGTQSIAKASQTLIERLFARADSKEHPLSQYVR